MIASAAASASSAVTGRTAPNAQSRANGAPRDEEPEGEERIALGVLPPAIGSADADAEAEATKPRRRTRKPRVEEDGDEIAPAA